MIDGTDSSCSATGKKLQATVSYDMGWQKRGSGRDYNSLTGIFEILSFCIFFAFFSKAFRLLNDQNEDFQE